MTGATLDGLRLAVYSDAHEVGGAEISLATLLGALDPGIVVDVLGIDDHVVSHIASARPSANRCVLPEPADVRDVRALRAHRDVLLTRATQVFHANLNSPWSCRYAILAASRVRGVRRMAVEQLVLPMRPRTRVVKRITTRMLDAHVAVGAASARALEEALHLPRGRVRTIHNAVEDRPIVTRESRMPKPVIGTFARLDAVKGLDVLVEALRRLSTVHAVIVGEGPEREALQAQARRAGVDDRLYLVGWDPNARELLGAFDLFVLPSRQEGLPLSICEAMLASKAVVATNVGSVSEVVDDGTTGLLVPPDDVTALADAVDALLADGNRRDRMGLAGRDRALEHFTAPRMAREYEELYAELVRHSPAPVRAAGW